MDIKATDDEGWSTTLPTFTIYKGDESQEEPAGSITVSIEAGTVGLGTILAGDIHRLLSGRTAFLRGLKASAEQRV